MQIYKAFLFFENLRGLFAALGAPPETPSPVSLSQKLQGSAWLYSCFFIVILHKNKAVKKYHAFILQIKNL